MWSADPDSIVVLIGANWQKPDIVPMSMLVERSLFVHVISIRRIQYLCRYSIALVDATKLAEKVAHWMMTRSRDSRVEFHTEWLFLLEILLDRREVDHIDGSMDHRKVEVVSVRIDFHVHWLRELAHLSLMDGIVRAEKISPDAIQWTIRRHLLEQMDWFCIDWLDHSLNKRKRNRWIETKALRETWQQMEDFYGGRRSQNGLKQDRLGEVDLNQCPTKRSNMIKTSTLD